MGNLAKLDFKSVKKLWNENQKAHVEQQGKIALKNKRNRELLKTFIEMYKELTGSDFKFHKKRFISYDNGNGKNTSKLLEGDVKRLNSLFTDLNDECKNVTVAAHVLCMMMSKWSEWDKSTSRNLIGFLETQAGSDLEVFIMKARKKTNNKENKLAMMTEKKHSENIDKHRKYFAKSA